MWDWPILPGLIEGIGRVDRENWYDILMPDESYRFPERPNLCDRLVRFPVFKRRLWEQMTPVMAGAHDLLHVPYDSCVAWKRAKFVTTVHDIKPLLFPVLARSRNIHSLIEQARIGDKWGRMDHVVTDSQCSKRDIVTHLKVPENCLTVVYPGIDLDRFRSVEPRTNSGRPYVLCVAGADPTKNVEILVSAFAALPTKLRGRYDLVLVGDFRRRPELRERAARLGIEKQTVFSGVVDDDRLIDLYQQAALFVFPSRYEGFGLSVLEAMAYGCPVVSSNASSLPEVVGDAVLLVDPMDVDGLAGAMKRVLSDPDLSRDLCAKGLVHAAQFSWDRTAREMVAVYKTVVEGSCAS